MFSRLFITHALCNLHDLIYFTLLLFFTDCAAYCDDCEYATWLKKIAAYSKIITQLTSPVHLTSSQRYFNVKKIMFKIVFRDFSYSIYLYLLNHRWPMEYTARVFA